jgi:hypothetical protein
MVGFRSSVASVDGQFSVLDYHLVFIYRLLVFCSWLSVVCGPLSVVDFRFEFAIACLGHPISLIVCLVSVSVSYVDDSLSGFMRCSIFSFRISVVAHR